MHSTRRQFLSTAMTAKVATAARKLPNLVIILADDLGYGDVGCYNPGSKIPTPNIDRLAARGVQFSDAHTPCGVCSPTRYGLLTGRYPWRTELKRQVLWPWDKPLIEADRLTLPKMLKSVGYHTAAIGKWHLGWNWPTIDGSQVNTQVRIGDPQRPIRYEFAKKVVFDRPIAGGPTARGFDTYFGVDLPNFPPYSFIENDRVLAQPTEQKPDSMFGWPGAMVPGWKLEEVLPAITKRAVSHVQERATRKDPFFLYLPLTAPHTPIAPHADFKGRAKAGDYGDFVHQVDWSVGQVLESLRKSGAEDNTLVFFTSDNGPENLTYPVLKEFGHASAGPLRGAKRMLYEGGHRVPFIAAGPGLARGRKESEIICLTDFMSTVAGIIGHELPENAAEDSYDISAALYGRPRSKPIREATVHHSMNDEYGLRQGDWVYIESADGGGGAAEPAWYREMYGISDPPQEAALYNLGTDLRERKNLYAQHPDRVRQMRELLRRYKTEPRSAPARKW